MSLLIIAAESRAYHRVTGHMRVLHVTQGYFPAIGGTERLVQRVSEELVQRWHDEVAVLTTDCYNGDAFYTPGLPSMPAGRSNLNGVRIRRLPVRRQLSRVLSTAAGARVPARSAVQRSPQGARGRSDCTRSAQRRLLRRPRTWWWPRRFRSCTCSTRWPRHARAAGRAC